MASLHHATLTAVLTFVVLVSGCAGLVPGTGATAAGGQAITIQTDTIDAMASVDSYRAVTNMDVSIGANRTFTNETTLVNHSMATAMIDTADGNATVHVVADWRDRNGSDAGDGDAGDGANVTLPVRDQVSLLNDSRVVDLRRTRTAGERTYQVALAPENATLAGMVVAQPDNGIDRAEAVTVLDRSYEVSVNRTTSRIRTVEMTLKFRYEGEIGRATMVTWFGGYNRTVPAIADRTQTAT